MSDEGEEWKGEDDAPSPFAYGSSLFSSMFKPATPEQIAAAVKAQNQLRAEAELRSQFVRRFSVDVKCVKCGHTEAKTRHHVEDTSNTYTACFAETAGKDHFDRTCKRCHYVWREWPLDHE